MAGSDAPGGDRAAAPEIDDRPRNPLQALVADAAARLQVQSVRGLVFAFDHLLRQQPWARDRLKQHAGSVVRVGLRAEPLPGLPVPDVRLAITPDGLLEPAAADLPPWATLLLEPSPDVLLSLSRDGVDGLSRHLRVEGDVMLAASLGELARHLRWDAEEDLSRLIGDVAARRAVGMLRGAFDTLRSLAQRPAESLGRFAASGQAPVVTREPLRALSDEFAALDDHLKRLEQRTDRLAAVH